MNYEEERKAATCCS